MSNFSSPVYTTQVQIASGQTVSGDIDLNGLRLFGITTPAALTGANLTFQVSEDGTNFFALVKDDGSAVTCAMAVDQAISLGDLFQHFAQWRYLRLVSDAAEGANRDFEIIARHV